MSMKLLGHNLFAVAAVTIAVLFAHMAKAADPGIYTTVDENSDTTTATANSPSGETVTRTFSTKSRTERTEIDDVNTPRRGFDDPRDPWDGRYSNDNPRNYTNNAVDEAREAKGLNRSAYAPGAFRTQRVGRNSR